MIERVFLRHGVADEDAGSEADAALRMDDRGDLRFALRRVIHAEAALAAEERRKIGGLVADDGNAHRLKILERASDVEDLLGAGADDRNRRVSKLLQVGGNIHGILTAAVHTADAAGSKHGDARHGRDDHRRSDGRRAGASESNIHRHVAAADFANVLGTAHDFQLLRRETDLEATLDDRAGRRNGAERADDLFHAVREIQIFRIRHTVAEDRALQRDDGLILIQRLPDLGQNVEIFFKDVHSSFSSRILLTSSALIPGLTVPALVTAMIPAAKAQRAACSGMKRCR